MPRKGAVAKREILPDPKFNDLIVAKLTNHLMEGGKKATAERIVYVAFDIVQKKAAEDPIKVFKKAIDNVKPLVEVKARRVGGATYQVPVEVPADRRVAMGMKWIITYARDRGEKTMAERLAGEILDASQNKGNAIKKREDTHKMAEANKAFAHYRW
ncbi:MAG: 30S ribosomal protein S7 [Myxococcota bacterium]|jgi:small subunit ribosomal protein S7